MSRKMKEPTAFDSKWPEGLEARKFYKIPCDDDGADGKAWLKLLITDDGDVHVTMHNAEANAGVPDPFPSIRIRTHAGGGRFTRTRQALLWLADAIRRDREEVIGLPG